MRRCITLTLWAAMAWGVGCSPQKEELPIYLDDSQAIEARIDDALQRLTLEEKVALCHAQSKFSSPGVPRLGIPELWMNDGPFGVRGEVLYNSWENADTNNDFCTAFPALTVLAATWDPTLAARYGNALGEEARYRRKDVLLAPGLNICRTPLNGRTFEYWGEDPFLTATLAVPYIRGIQKNGVAACVKHFAVNNQEQWRDSVEVEVSDRALREIYFPAFKAAVQDGGAWALMGAYNLLRGEHCCHNDFLLNKVLKEEWGFDGAVISDWGGVHDTKEAAMNGTDIEMGTLKPYEEYYMADSMLALFRRNEVPVARLDDKVRRILRLNMRTAMNRTRPYGSLNSKEHVAVAREVAEQGIVLLKNDAGLLPIDLPKVRSIAVIGENAVRRHAGGGGAAKVKALYEVTPLEGIRARFGDTVRIDYAMGYCSDTPLEDRVVPPQYDNAKLRKEAIALAAVSDVVLFIGGLNHNRYQDSEAFDRESYQLPYGQEQLIEDIFAVNKNVVLVLVSGSPVDLCFAQKLPAIVEGWYCGSESGNALAAVLAGDVNPSGKLPFSFPRKLEDCGAHAFDAKTYPGENLKTTYTEDILVGYRWYDTKGIAPLYAFGYGLSYTKFEYGAPEIDRKTYSKDGIVHLGFDLTNVGDLAGAEVSQVYVSQPGASVMRPAKELKGFAKTYLKKGETKRVEIDLPVKEWAFWDTRTSSWVVEPGEFLIHVGASSDDIKFSVSVNVE
ncbi:MAG TPA: glycoside hydrolase family 3 C-terminal domain-containing protein [Candidatus Alistipes intestinipullorum]|nr:glycoside hydrolase family 3 C-terminal domain-containing protein [Candidatus Alistipes intestinipullorum]